MGAFYLVCARVVYDSYDKAQTFGKKCPCYAKLAPNAATDKPKTLDEALSAFTDRDKVPKKHPNVVENGANDAFEDYSEVKATADLIFSTSFGMKCLDDINCAAAVFYIFRGGLLVAAIAASQFVPMLNFVVALLMIVDFDPQQKRLDISIQYFIGLLFLVTSAFIMNFGTFVRNTGVAMPAFNVGNLFAAPAVVPAVGPVADIAVRRDKNGRFSTARAITN